MVQVHHDEGIAIHIDLESCAAAREGNSEAVTGECAGQPSSRESTLFPGADVVPLTEGNTDGRDIASAQTARRGRRHWHAWTLLAREPGDLTTDRSATAAGPHREGEEP
jgi:hypothetical protein